MAYSIEFGRKMNTDPRVATKSVESLNRREMLLAK